MRRTGTLNLSKAPLLLALAVGCTAAGPGQDNKSREPSTYAVDLARANQVWPGVTPAQSAEDLMRIAVTVGPRTIIADTHLFGVPVNVIPYDDTDNATDAAGTLVGRGDGVIAQYFAPGEFGIAVKHHRPQYRSLALDNGDPDAMKEHFKLQDTHIEIVVGVEDRDGAPGAITLNNPQTYPDASNPGRFGDDHYPMIFLKPVYPAYLDDAQRSAFNDNMRSMALGFNAVSNFPGNYNGGDPLAARSPDLVRTHVAQMVRAIAGDEEARLWFREPQNLIYCAELAFVSMSAGMIVPLNTSHIEPLVGPEVWSAFQEQVAMHNRGESSAFTSLNGNPRARHVLLTVAPDNLAPVSAYAPSGSGAENQLAFQPDTMADIVEQFLATHLPRRELGEELAPFQGAALLAMKPGLLEAMTLDQVPLLSDEDMANAPQDQLAALTARRQVEQLFMALVTTVSTDFGTYEEFRRNLEPLLGQARRVTGPRDGSGNGLFVPPSLMHVVAQGRHPAGLLGLSYVGHGFHYSMVLPVGDGEPTLEPMPQPEPNEEDPGYDYSY